MESKTCMTGVSKRVSLAYLDLNDIPKHVVQSALLITELDLSNNCISDLRFLVDFVALETLIVDHNQLSSHVKIPFLPRLHTLWLNHNHINNLPMFIATLSQNCPNLRFLSMMNNEAAPSYFNGGSLTQYIDYRQYVISQLPHLEVLDDKLVTEGARAESLRIYYLQNRVLANSVTKKRRNSRRRSSSSNYQPSQNILTTDVPLMSCGH